MIGDINECPYCNNYKEYIYEKGAIGEIIGHCWDGNGGHCETSRICGNCKKGFTIVTGHIRNGKGNTYIKYNTKNRMDNKGAYEVSYDIMEL